MPAWAPARGRGRRPVPGPPGRNRPAWCRCRRRSSSGRLSLFPFRLLLVSTAALAHCLLRLVLAPRGSRCSCGGAVRRPRRCCGQLSRQIFDDVIDCLGFWRFRRNEPAQHNAPVDAAGGGGRRRARQAATLRRPRRPGRERAGLPGRVRADAEVTRTLAAAATLAPRPLRPPGLIKSEAAPTWADGAAAMPLVVICGVPAR